MNTIVSPPMMDEEGRLRALRRYEILDTEPEKSFDDIVALVQSIFNVKYAAINLIESQRLWSKATVGCDRYETVRDQTLCDYAMQSNTGFSVEDALADPVFAQFGGIKDGMRVRSYLGVPLSTPEGFNIGAICVFDDQPRKFSTTDLEVLRNFARVVMSQFELRLCAQLDSLTSTLSRRAFMERLDQAIEKAAQDSYLILIDVDHFKSINDTFGHMTGDHVLVGMTMEIAGKLPRGDSLGRLGGEEFGLLVHHKDKASLEQLIEDIRATLTQWSVPQLSSRKVTVSMGVAGCLPGEPRESWLQRADQALYHAKETGRDKVTYAP